MVATGRKGADWLEKTCEAHNVEHTPGTVDIGVRVEVRNEVMEEINAVLYESKLIGYPLPFKNKVRTFCQNPGGFVSQENYDNDLAVVNVTHIKSLRATTQTLLYFAHTISAYRSTSLSNMRRRSASLPICSVMVTFLYSVTAIFLTKAYMAQGA